MSEEEKAAARARGSLDDFIMKMQAEMDNRQRSPEYRKQFWNNLQNCFSDEAHAIYDFGD